jgi:hypothetical protein
MLQNIVTGDRQEYTGKPCHYPFIVALTFVIVFLACFQHRHDIGLIVSVIVLGV